MSATLRSIGIETAKTLYDTIRGRDSNFLFFLGGAETVTENKNTIDDDNVIWENINFLQKVRDTDVSIVARRVNWSSGTVYYPYDSSGIPESGMSGGVNNYYVMNEDKHNVNFKLKDRVYRCTKNAQIINEIDELSDDDYKRIEKYEEHIQLEPWKKDGKYILVFEPSDFAKRWWEVPNWTEDTINLLKANTDLEIRIRKKNSLVSFESEVKGAKAVVSLQSAAAIQAHIWGIPGYCAEMSAAYPVSHSLEMIQKGLDSIQYIPDDTRQKWLNSILANQYTMTEIADGTCWNRLKDK